jgi:AraC-like DNA-binding protein
VPPRTVRPPGDSLATSASSSLATAAVCSGLSFSSIDAKGPTSSRAQSQYSPEAPLAYVHRLRIDAARHPLETKQKSVAEVGRAVGYEDLGFFRRLFKRHTGAGPREYRDLFGPRARVPGGAAANASVA